MKITSARRAAIAAVASTVVVSWASAQTILFDFNNAPLHSSLPIDQTMGGITAHFSATGQGFSIQDTSSPVVPVGFTGRFIYPNSIFAADLLINFDHTLTSFSILYSPQELGCDDSALMRVTASMNGTFVGSNTMTASNPGTWPVETLSCTFAQGFNSVVVHYDSHPPTCQDYGTIFLADDMRVTPISNVGTPFCFGDGTAAACPCANSGAAGHGCATSTFAGGALLTASGVAGASSGTDTLLLTASDLAGPGLFFQASGLAATPMNFGDGLLCASVGIIRLGVVFPTAGVASYPGGLTSNPIHIAGGPIAAGNIRHYQCWIRDAVVFCTPETFNTTNGVTLTWSP